MRKLLGSALVMLGLVTLVGAACAQDVYLHTFPVSWRVNSTTDSTYKTLSMVGATAVPDTSGAIKTYNWAWGAPGLPQVGSITTGALYAIARISVVSTNGGNGAVDTLFVAVDSSPDGTNWNNGAYVGYGQGSTAGTDACLTAPIVMGIGATTAGSALPTALSSYLRLRIRPDGNSSAVFTAAKLYISALCSRMAQ